MQVERFPEFGVGCFEFELKELLWQFRQESNLEHRTSNFENSGGRVSNAWITCPRDRDNAGKLVLIPDTFLMLHSVGKKGVIRSWMDPRPIS